MFDAAWTWRNGRWLMSSVVCALSTRRKCPLDKDVWFRSGPLVWTSSSKRGKPNSPQSAIVLPYGYNTILKTWCSVQCPRATYCSNLSPNSAFLTAPLVCCLGQCRAYRESEVWVIVTDSSRSIDALRVTCLLAPTTTTRASRPCCSSRILSAECRQKTQALT